MQYLLYFFSILLCIFQDLPLANYIGEFGRSISGIFAIVVILISILINKKIVFNKMIKVLVGLLLFLLVYNILGILVYFFVGKPMIFLGENIIIKSTKIFMYYFSNVLFFISLYQIAINLDEKKIIKPFYIIYILLFIVVVLEYLQMPSAFPFLHATRPFAYNRIRLFTNESSNTSTMILVFFTLAFQYSKKYKNRFSNILLIIMLLFFMYTTTTKTLFIIISLSLIIMVLFNKRVKIKYKIGISLIYIFAIFFLSNSVLHYFDLAYNSSTTLYTRGYSWVIALLISLKYPIGVGNTLYLNVYTNHLKEYLSTAYQIIKNFNGKEISLLLSSGSDKNIGAYSGIIQYGMYWGIVGNYIFLKSLFINVTKTIQRNSVLFFGFTSVLLAILTSISLDNKFEVWAFIFVLMMYEERELRKNE